MKKEILVLVVLFFSLTFVFASEYTTLFSYYDSLNNTCSKDSDCFMKNVGNCEGYYPMCLNEDSVLDASVVESICVDGDPLYGSKNVSFAYCKCQEDECVAQTGNINPKCGDNYCYRVEIDEKSDYYCPEDCDIVVENEEIEEVVQNDSVIEVEENNLENETNESRDVEENESSWIGGFVVFILIIAILLFLIWKFLPKKNKKFWNYSSK